MTRALIIGSAGQDGSYLREQLVARGVEVVGLDSKGPRSVLRAADVDGLLREVRPEHLFYLAAFHHSSQNAPDADLTPVFHRSFEVHVEGWVHVLEAMGRHAPGCRAFYAASSHVFGTPTAPVQNEQTPFAPRTPYAISKATGVEIAHLYRRRGLHVSCGILYNHESPRRPPHFVSQRIAAGAVAGAASALELGDLSAVVDWGWAPDFTEAMWRITQQAEPEDYVVATGEPHTVRDFCAAAYSAVGLDWQQCVVEKPSTLKRHVAPLVGDASKLKTKTGWAPTVDFGGMVQRLVEAARAGTPG